MHMHKHLQVYNLAPTISSLTAQTPGRYVWRILIALHSAPRLLALLCYWTYYERVLTTYIEPRFRLRLRQNQRQRASTSSKAKEKESASAPPRFAHFIEPTLICSTRLD